MELLVNGVVSPGNATQVLELSDNFQLNVPRKDVQVTSMTPWSIQQGPYSSVQVQAEEIRGQHTPLLEAASEATGHESAWPVMTALGQRVDPTSA